MFYVGNTFDRDGGGYKTIQNAKKQAEKKGMKVFDENGEQVFPEVAEERATVPQDEPETVQAREITTEQEKAAETAQDGATGGVKIAGVELTDDVPAGALDENPDGSVNTYDENGQKVGTASAEEAEKLQEAAGKIWQQEVAGTVEVVRDGMIALRNAPKWAAGHKCGIAKKGYKARVIGKIKTPDGALYKLENGRYISGREGDTVFTPDGE